MMIKSTHSSVIAPARSILLAVALIFSTSPVIADTAERLIKCTNAETSDHFYIDMYRPSDFGEAIHCLVGTDFVIDMTPCAPSGGWGLSRGTGLADLAEVTHSWAYASTHPNGKMAAYVGATELSFVTSFGEGLPGRDNYTGVVEVDRITGEGLITVDDVSTSYACDLVERKF